MQVYFLVFLCGYKKRPRRLSIGRSHVLYDLLSGKQDVLGALAFLVPVARVTAYEPFSFMQLCSFPALLHVYPVFGRKLNLLTAI